MAFKPRFLVPLSLALIALSPANPTPRKPPLSGTVVVAITPSPVNSFRPDEALGAGVDGQERGDVPATFTPANIAAMRSAGLRPLTYRLRTELGVEAWHWNPHGRWSDPARNQGYWTSDSRPAGAITECYGYRLPRRGSTIDQANNDGYSRIDDGDRSTFWKSNPYLDRHYTGEDNARHPQWIVIDLGHKGAAVNAIRLLWGAPYATRYAIEYWDGPDAIYINENKPGRWIGFPHGVVEQSRGGIESIRFSERTIHVRFVRVVMTQASGIGPTGSKDVRDRLGYAIRELYLGVMDAAGRFHDVIRHAKDHARQTVMYASSTDPWHRASDIDYRVEQPGFDRFYRCGLTNGLPALVPVPMLYDNPDNAVAEVHYLKARGYPIRAVELGEEPDGQYITPEDYAALYVRWADALHRIDPKLTLGGPCFQTTVTDVAAWPDRPGNRSWMNRFLNYLREHGHEKDYGFFSFEWYPFDDLCKPTAPQLARAPAILARVLARLQRAGLSKRIPWYITEYGYSAFAGQAEVDIPGALLNADIVGSFLTLGGDAAYLYGYEPNLLMKELACDTWGNNMMFLSDDDRRIRYRLPTYWAARLLSRAWAQPGHGAHKVYAASSDVRTATGAALVTAYALQRPDGLWSLVLINKDPAHAYAVNALFQDATVNRTRRLRGPITVYQYSGAQYQWHPNRARGYPIRSLPPSHRSLTAGPATQFLLPAYSLTILRGHLSE